MYTGYEERDLFISALRQVFAEDPTRKIYLKKETGHNIDTFRIKMFCEKVMKSNLPFDVKKKIVEALAEPKRYLDEEQAKILGVNKGTKTSRAIMKILKKYGSDIPYSIITRFCDDINEHPRMETIEISTVYRDINDGTYGCRTECPNHGKGYCKCYVDYYDNLHYSVVIRKVK